MRGKRGKGFAQERLVVKRRIILTTSSFWASATCVRSGAQRKGAQAGIRTRSARARSEGRRAWETDIGHRVGGNACAHRNDRNSVCAESRF
jgi:hypothetical protein